MSGHRGQLGTSAGIVGRRRKRRAHGVPEVRGMLRSFRMCSECTGRGYSLDDRGQRDETCDCCRGLGHHELLAEEYDTVATRQALDVVRATQGKGKLGRNQ